MTQTLAKPIDSVINSNWMDDDLVRLTWLDN